MKNACSGFKTFVVGTYGAEVGETSVMNLRVPPPGLHRQFNDRAPHVERASYPQNQRIGCKFRCEVGCAGVGIEANIIPFEASAPTFSNTHTHTL